MKTVIRHTATVVPQVSEKTKLEERHCDNASTSTETITSSQILSEQTEQLTQLNVEKQRGGSQDVTIWPGQQASPSCYSGSSDAQVIFQSIDQELLYKVANILSASNDASSLIAEWSQAPNKVQTCNLEDQLRHFADHHQQVLAHNTGQNNAPLTDQKELVEKTQPLNRPS